MQIGCGELLALEKQRRESDYLENGIKFADGEDYGKSIYQPRRR